MYLRYMHEEQKKMTKEEKRTIKRICKDYSFENYGELKRTFKFMYGDTVDEYWFTNPNDELDRLLTL